MKTGFVILNYNSWELAEKLINTIKKYKIIDLIVVVDNSSTDDESYIKLKQTEVDSRILVYRTTHNGGYSYGNNFGMSICKENNVDVAFIANPDIFVSEKTLNEILYYFQKTDYSLISTLQYEISGELGKPIIQKRYTYKDDLLDCSYLYRKFVGNHGVPLNKRIEIQPVNMFRGSFFGIRTEHFFDVGGFDENVFLFCEERILSNRLERKGYKIGILTNGRYDHMHSVSINKSYKETEKKIRLLYKSRLYYNITYNGIGHLKKILLKFFMNISLLEYRLKK